MKPHILVRIYMCINTRVCALSLKIVGILWKVQSSNTDGVKNYVLCYNTVIFSYKDEMLARVSVNDGKMICMAHS